ncbi:hypothetical protein CEXT_472971 [Caerostris extrusa]|uniref:Uncharacterized protein n=1 Tax=Caerostris extrusa TaxID=172846 RepID=A0AAV4X9T1_CAEEX|nr:hypothetical protein CEXT_472971 [Caerostris extrusa]
MQSVEDLSSPKSSRFPKLAALPGDVHYDAHPPPASAVHTLRNAGGLLPPTPSPKFFARALSGNPSPVELQRPAVRPSTMQIEPLDENEMKMKVQNTEGNNRSAFANFLMSGSPNNYRDAYSKKEDISRQQVGGRWGGGGMEHMSVPPKEKESQCPSFISLPYPPKMISYRFLI